MIRYSLPDFTAGLGLNLLFARIAMMHPEAMQPDVHIDSIYGCFPNCTLNGGRALVRKPYDAEAVERTFAILDEYDLHARLTLTNMLATPEDLDVPYVRMILNIAAAHGAHAIVYSDEIRDALRQRFHVPCTLSTTRAIEDVAELNRQLNAYDCVVLNYNHGKDDAFLAQIEHPGRLEVMVNEYCVPHCPYRQEHYLHNSQDQRDGALRPFPCKSGRPEFFNHESDHPIMFTNAEVRALHERHGIELFKIVGRGTGFAANLEALAYYLIRPEYRGEVKAAARAAASQGRPR